MNKLRFTPGPWRQNGYYRVSAGTHSVASVGEDGGTNNALANAYLIAAAPDLYAALECVLAIKHGSGPDGGEMQRAYDSARAALAKARGEAL